MKGYIVAAFFACVLVVVSAKSCREQADCTDDQCCVGFMPFRGTCRSFTKKGGKCLVDEPLFPFNEIHIVACPCTEGLECVKKSAKGDSGVCQEPEPETTEGPTTTDASSEEQTSAQPTESEESSESAEVTSAATEQPEEKTPVPEEA